MALITCPECGKEISDQAISCPNCGLPIRAQSSNQQNKNTVVSKPMTHKSSNKVPTWVIILCVIIGFMYFAWFIAMLGNNANNQNDSYTYNSYQSYTESTTESKLAWYQQRNEDLNITVTDVYSNSSYTVCEGTIKNNGITKYEYIKIKGSFMNKSGEILDTDWTYGIGSEGLASGETTSFRLSVKKNSDIIDCKITYISD